MNIKQIENILIQSGIEPNEAKVEAKILIKHVFSFSDKDLILNEEFDEREIEPLVQFRAQSRKPIQYILGYAHFMGEDFIVNENVLIPRDETEILVRKAIDLINVNKYKKVLDIGTGSGCIACIIAKNSDAQVIGVDISTKALNVALDNSSKMGLYNKAIFRKSNLFSNIREKFDLIVSNPPYIPITEKDKLQLEVGFEPMSALFSDDEQGINFYKNIINSASNFLNKNGYLIFELGINQSLLVKELMEMAGFVGIEIEKDLAYIDRVIYGRIND